MVTGPLKGQVDKVWDAFWSGGIANPEASDLGRQGGGRQKPQDSEGSSGSSRP